MGWNGSDIVRTLSGASKRAENEQVRENNAPMREKTLRSTRRLATLLSVLLPILLCIIAGYFYFCNSGDSAQRAIENQEKPNAIKRVDNPNTTEELPQDIPSNCVAKVETPKAPEPQVLSVRTNANGSIVTRLRMPDGSTRRSIKSPPPIWDNAADQLIAFAISIEPGVEAPPLPAGVSNQEFRRALKKDIVINADDSERVKEIKRRVREARQEILEVMDATGKSFEEVLNDHRSQMNQNSSLYHEALRGLAEIEKNGTPDDVAKYIKKSNELLRSQGARELPTRNFENQMENTKESK
jgi:flagellar basal body-associated protein FliL